MTDTKIELEHMLDPEETAAILDVKVQTLATWRTGRGPKGLPFVKVGRGVRYLKRDVQAFMDSRRVMNTTEGAHL